MRKDEVLHLEDRTVSAFLLRGVVDQDSVRRVVRVVGPGVVLAEMDPSPADRADRSEAQVPEVDEEVGSDPANLPVDLLREEDARSNRTSLLVGDRLDLFARASSARSSYSEEGIAPSGSRPATFRKTLP